MPTSDTYTMTPETFADLRARAAFIALQDREVGLMFTALVLHIGHAFGLDPAKEDARLAAVALEAARQAEDERVQDAEEARAKVRAAEDAQTGLTPDQLAVRTTARAAEDEKAKADAVSLQEARDAEDARLADAANTAQDQAAADQQPADVVEPNPLVTEVPPVVAPDQAAIDAPTNVAQAPVQEGI